MALEKLHVKRVKKIQAIQEYLPNILKIKNIRPKQKGRISLLGRALKRFRNKNLKSSVKKTDVNIFKTQ